MGGMGSSMGGSHVMYGGEDRGDLGIYEDPVGNQELRQIRQWRGEVIDRSIDVRVVLVYL